jgi:hypothetical protein
LWAGNREEKPVQNPSSADSRKHNAQKSEEPFLLESDRIRPAATANFALMMLATKARGPDNRFLCFESAPPPIGGWWDGTP